MWQQRLSTWDSRTQTWRATGCGGPTPHKSRGKTGRIGIIMWTHRMAELQKTVLWCWNRTGKLEVDTALKRGETFHAVNRFSKWVWFVKKVRVFLQVCLVSCGIFVLLWKLLHHFKDALGRNNCEADSPENWHLNVKKFPKIWHLKKIAKNAHFVPKNCQWNFSKNNVTFFLAIFWYSKVKYPGSSVEILWQWDVLKRPLFGKQFF